MPSFAWESSLWCQLTMAFCTLRQGINTCLGQPGLMASRYLPRASATRSNGTRPPRRLWPTHATTAANCRSGRRAHRSCDDPPSVAQHGTPPAPTGKLLACELMAKSNISSRMVIGLRKWQLRWHSIHEDVESSELRFDARNHPANFFRLQTSACKTKPSEPQARNFSRVALADLLSDSNERNFCSGFPSLRAIPRPIPASHQSPAHIFP